MSAKILQKLIRILENTFDISLKNFRRLSSAETILAMSLGKAYNITT